MDIKSVENKFLEQMVDRMDSVSGLTYNNVFLSCTGIENVDSYNLALPFAPTNGLLFLKLILA